MTSVATIGLDIAKSVFQLHGVNAAGQVVNRQRTQLSNAFRAHLSEFGIVAPIGRRGLDQLLAIVADDEDPLCRAAWNTQALAYSVDAAALDKVAAVALANKTARMIWALMTSGERYRERR